MSDPRSGRDPAAGRRRAQSPAAVTGRGPRSEPRRLSPPLMLAILAVPILFAWLLLRPGYSRDLRIGAFLYTFAFPALTLLLFGVEALRRG